ncbi:MAG: hypothetical protein JRJ19_12405 [Deltaproteobacteria bacterium]|nr:hypothetical protein [Deltaproteobacteria bacterium]
MSNKDAGSTTSVCPSDFGLEAFWLDGQPKDSPAGRHINQCRQCQARLKTIEDEAGQFRQEIYPATVEAVADRVIAEQSVFKGLFTRLFFSPRLAAVAALGVLIVVLTIVVFPPEQSTEKDDGYIGIKGTVGLQIVCKRQELVFRLNAGDSLVADDSIQFVVAAPGPGFVMVVSMTEDGGLSLYYPAGSRQARQISGQEQTLPGSIILDDSRGAERIFVLFSTAQFDFEAVKQAAARGLSKSGSIGELEKLPLDVAQTSLLFLKGGA